MPWLETVPVEERFQFIQDALSDRFTMSELCARYGVSRRIGYKWLSRYEEEGRRGLKDRSRTPHHCPHRIDDELAEIICDFRGEHPFRSTSTRSSLPRWMSVITSFVGNPESVTYVAGHFCYLSPRLLSPAVFAEYLLGAE